MAQRPAAAAAPARRDRAKKQVHKAVSKKRKFVKDGVFYAELNQFLSNELSEEGYAGCEVRVTPQRTEIIIRATNTGGVIGDNGRRIRELTALIQKRFKFPRNGLICFAERVRNKGFSALTQAQAVKFRLLSGLTVRRAAYSCLKYIMDDSDRKKGAMGCEIIVSGKLRGQRAKGMKFRDGFMIHAGDATNYYIDTAVKHVHLPQGVIGIKVKIMKPYDSTGRDGVPLELPDKVKVLDPKDENEEAQIGGGGGDRGDGGRYGGGNRGGAGGGGGGIHRPPQAPTGGNTQQGGAQDGGAEETRPPMPPAQQGGSQQQQQQQAPAAPQGGQGYEMNDAQFGGQGQQGGNDDSQQYGARDEQAQAAPPQQQYQAPQQDFQQYDQFGGQGGQFDQYQAPAQQQYGGQPQYGAQQGQYYDQNRNQNYQNY